MFPLKPLRFGYANIRSPYVYIHFPETLWIFGDANSLIVYMFPLKPLRFWIRQYSKPLRVYIFPEALLILETPIHWKCICFPWNPLDFGYANIWSPYVYIHFPETLWILKTPIHWKPLSIRGPSIPLNSEALGFWYPWNIEPCTPRKPHIGSKVCYVMVLRGVGVEGGEPPIPWDPGVCGSLVPLIHWGRNWIFGPFETFRP